MKVVIPLGDKAMQFVTIFQHLKMKITDANLVFDEEKMYMQGMDNSQIGLFELKLLANWFQEYEVSQPVTLGINCELLHKMLNCLDRLQNIILTFEEDGDNLDIQFTSAEKGIIDKHFILPLMDIDIPLMQIPPTEYTADIILAAAVFEKIIEQLLIFADSVKVICSEDSVSLKTTSSSTSEFGQMEAKIQFDDMTEYAIEEDTTLNLTFSLEHLNWMVQFSKLCNEMSIHFKKDIPLKLTYNLTEDCFIQFFLAPKFEDY